MHDFGSSAWLRREPLPATFLESPAGHCLSALRLGDRALGDTAWQTAIDELSEGLQALTGRAPAQLSGAAEDSTMPAITLHLKTALPAETYGWKARGIGLELYAASGAALIHGVFRFLECLQLSKDALPAPQESSPPLELRLITQWDNLDGSIERGYAGRSIFNWRNPAAAAPRVRAYARLLASLGLNGIVVNNVTAQAEFLAADRRPALAQVADSFRAYGLQLFLSANSGAPLLIGGLSSADPLDPGVRAWWRETVDALYAAIPDFGGFSVKADCEGVPGPHDYGRTHADGANCLAEALAPHGGRVLWRTFVYPLPKEKTAFDHFREMDGAFAENVVLMIKNGPVDFQPAEPLHPLFGQTPQTPQLAEFQVIQEYTGQTTHACYLGDYWQRLLASDTGIGSATEHPLRDHLAGAQGRGIAGISNIGDDANWFRHPLNGANLYAYGRLAWDPQADAGDILRDWSRLTFGDEPEVTATVSSILAASYPAYLAGTHPFGLTFLTDYEHFRPMLPERIKNHQADASGVGPFRHRAEETGSWQHYPERVKVIFGDPQRCPPDLLLFFHHLPWDFQLPNERVLSEAFFAGIEAYPKVVGGWQEAWKHLEGRIPDTLHHSVAERLQAQAQEARIWRDALIAFFSDYAATPAD